VCAKVRNTSGLTHNRFRLGPTYQIRERHACRLAGLARFNASAPATDWYSKQGHFRPINLHGVLGAKEETQWKRLRLRRMEQKTIAIRTWRTI
jgi:hypothetical protein